MTAHAPTAEQCNDRQSGPGTATPLRGTCGMVSASTTARTSAGSTPAASSAGWCSRNTVSEDSSATAPSRSDGTPLPRSRARRCSAAARRGAHSLRAAPRESLQGAEADLDPYSKRSRDILAMLKFSGRLHAVSVTHGLTNRSPDSTARHAWLELLVATGSMCGGSSEAGC